MGKFKALGKGASFYFAIILVLTVLATGTTFITGHGQMFMKKYFGVWEQNIETEIYKETEQYNEAKAQQLAKYKLEWEKSTPEERKTLKFVITQRYADYEAKRLPEGLAEFLIKVRGY